MKSFYALIALLCAGTAFAAPATPLWSRLKAEERPERKLFLDGKTPVIRISAEPRGASVEPVKAAFDGEALVIDASRMAEAGITRLILNWNTIPERRFPEGKYTLTLNYSGPAGELFLEGKDLNGKHFYRRQKVTEKAAAITVDLPPELAELHLRFDLPSPGVYRFTAADFSPAAPEVKPVVKEAAPELIFYAPFDGSAKPAVAAGNGVPLKEQGLEFVDGLKGKALRSTKAARSQLEYAIDRNLVPERGTIALWFKPEWSEVASASSDKANWHALLSMERPASRLGSGAVWFWCNGAVLRGDTSDEGDSFLHSTRLLTPGVWRHLAFTWSEKGSMLYIDGKPGASIRDSASPLKIMGKVNAYQRDKHSLKNFFVGGHGSAEQADGVIDELKIYSAPLSPAEIEQLSTEFRPFELKLGQLYFMEGERVRVPFRIQARDGKPRSVEWQILAAGGKTAASGQSAGEGAVELVSPAPGSYEMRAGGETRLFWILRRDNPWLAKNTELKTEPVSRLVPTAGMSADRFLSVGENRMGELAGRSYLEAGSKRGDRFAIRFELPDADSIYLLEWDYPDDKKRTCDILAQSSQLKESEYELQVGYMAGDEYPNSHRMLTQKAVYFPRSRDFALVFMTAREEAPAAVAEIRVSRIIGGLPAARVNPAPPVDGQRRDVGVYYEDPAINYGFGVSGAAMPGFETMIDRLVAYLKYSGQNLFAYPLVWYHGYIGETYNPRNHAEDFLDAFLLKFDAANLEFLGTMNQNNMPFPRELITPKTIADGSLHPTAIAIWDTGKPNPGGWHGTAPNFNIFHADVQKEVLANVDRILAVGAAHPSFKGIVLHLPRHSMLWPGDITSGYNDYVIEAFEKETGVKVPVDRQAPLRGKLYAEWLLANRREEWIDWRCRKLARFYRDLADRLTARRSDLRLVVNSMIPIPQTGEARFTASDYVEVKNREAGLDPKYYRDADNIILDQTIYPADYRWRSGRPTPPEVLAKLRTIDTEKSTYELLGKARAPWLHMHDRYWESAVGSATRKEHWSDKPNALTAPWFREQAWRVTTLNPAGFHAMRHYVLPLRYTDLLGVTKGGFLMGTYGMEEELTPFVQAFRALPAKRFNDLATGSKTVVARQLEGEGAHWFYVVNTDGTPAKATVECSAGAVDLVGGGTLAKGRSTLELAPYQLRSFKAPAGSRVVVMANHGLAGR